MKLDIDKERAMFKAAIIDMSDDDYPLEKICEDDVTNFAFNAWLAARSAGLSQEPVARIKRLVNSSMIDSTGCKTAWEDLPDGTELFATPPAPVSAEPVAEVIKDGYEICWLNRTAAPKGTRLYLATPAAPLSDAKDAERRGHYDDAKLRDIGAETYRACGELPFGYEIIIELENGAGSVTLCDPDGEKQCFEGSDYFANDIRNAIDAAIAAAKEAGK